MTRIKVRKVKGASNTLESGVMGRGIHLQDEPAMVECREKKIRGLVLRTQFLKKA